MMSLRSTFTPLCGTGHCPEPVCRVRWSRDGRFFRSRPASWLFYAVRSQCKARPSSCFRGISSPS
nr:hypothetical protein [Enterobacter asburiae]